MRLMWLAMEICIWCAFLYYFLREKKKRDQVYLRDILTGGWNRAGFLREAEKHIKDSNCHSYVVVYFNISDFRSVNKKWGEQVGNQILCLIYRVLHKNLTHKELVCHSNMDRFIMLLRGESDDMVSQRTAKMVELVNLELQKYGNEFKLHFSIGACWMGESEGITNAVDNAIYASRDGCGDGICKFYDYVCAKQLAEEKELTALFDQAIQNREFQVYLQPKVPTVPDGVTRAEALVRWVNPQKGLIGPDRFIPLLEKNGDINILDQYMFEAVCQLIVGRIRANKPPIEIAVNISRYHLRNEGRRILPKYRAIKEKYQIPDGMLQLELTETVMYEFEQMEYLKEVLAGFRSFGVKVALDDFGSAWSSLSVLKEFDLDVLKLDRVFFTNKTIKSKMIVTRMIQLAHDLDMQVVAEGIEDPEQVEMLKEMGCDYIQGYIYSKPLPTGEFEKWEERQ